MSSIKLITSRLLDDCVQHISESDTIYLLVSFLMESGVRLLIPYLKQAATRGADIKILTGDYLFVTQPEALEAICRIHPDIEVRLWQSQGASFHPKAYLFRKATGEHVVIIGSSNISKSALTTGIEWNLSVQTLNYQKSNHQIPFDEAELRFLDLFIDERTIPVNSVSVEAYRLTYAKYHQDNTNLAQVWSEAEALETMFGDEDPYQGNMVHRDGPVTYIPTFTPRPAQVEALEQLAVTKSEGYDKALVVMATGLGKTFVAAMFAQDFRRVLFIAHREEILKQAQKTFRMVSPDKSTGLYTGHQKEADVAIVFASIQTLGSKRHRSRFPQDHFDLIIVDEFHHAAAATYSAVMTWFQPQFLLGLTATPDRADGREVYALCDRNVAYRVEFLEAIDRGWLAPFHYYGVYDETDYSQIRWLGTRYDEQELLEAQTRKGMAEVVYNAWMTHRQTRGLAFCSSVAQAKYLTDYFSRQGVRCVCLHGASSPTLRGASVRQLADGQIDLIFTVDLFNEGVDIPAVDTLLFARPTESLTVFTQQVGRGLRIHPGKSHCTIIDLIGNYRNADLKLSLFSAAESMKDFTKSGLSTNVPSGCGMHLDLRVIDLIREMRRKKQPRKDRLIEAYHEAKLELGRRPTYEEMHLLGHVDSRGFKQEYGSYVAFLNATRELSDIESETYRNYEDWFREVESTGMTKAYKMVVLLAMLERGPQNWYKRVTPVEVATFFHRFYMEKEYRWKIDFSDAKTKGILAYDESKVAALIAEMPMTKWAGSSRGLAKFDGERFWFDLNVGRATMERALFDWTEQVCKYRLHVYFERKGQMNRHILMKQ